MKKCLYAILILLFTLFGSIYASANGAEDNSVSEEQVSITYITDGEELCVVYDSGEKVRPIRANEKRGYIFIGWSTENGAIYNFSEPVTENVTLFAAYTLAPAVGAVKDVSFVYDGNERMLSIEEIYHALDTVGGDYSYEWYKDGDFISDSDSVCVSSVSDSGIYCCKLNFAYRGETVSTVLDNIEVDIKPRMLVPPTIEAQIYTGEKRIPEIETSNLYTYELLEVTDAGEYNIAFTLTDCVNYRWKNSDTDIAISVFGVLKANNEFNGEIKISDIYYGAECDFWASSKFGEVEFLYSESADGTYSDTFPEDVGSYFVKAVVREGKNYYGIESEPIPFSVISNNIVYESTYDRFNFGLLVLFLIFILAISAVSILLLILTRAAKKHRAYSAENKSHYNVISDIVSDSDECEADFSLHLGCEKRSDTLSEIMGINAQKADALISDSLARNLINREKGAIITRGHAKACVSVEILSKNFVSGERVDINALKEKGLVSDSCAYLEIKAEGTINKPLKVYANEYSLCAVKMIALCGGEVIKTITFRQKGDKNPKK